MRNDLLKVTYLINARAWAIDTAPSCILSTLAHMNPLSSFPKGSRMWCFLNSHYICHRSRPQTQKYILLPTRAQAHTDKGTKSQTHLSGGLHFPKEVSKHIHCIPNLSVPQPRVLSPDPYICLLNSWTRRTHGILRHSEHRWALGKQGGGAGRGMDLTQRLGSEFCP